MADEIDLEGFKKIKFQLDQIGILSFKVITGSMSPLIKIGEKIIVAKRNEPLSKFDIIVFFLKDKLICHFIWHVNSIPSPDGVPIYVTRSLLNQEDLPILEDQILGLVVSHKISFWMRLKAVLASARRQPISY